MTGFTRDDLAVGLRFLAALPRFLRTPMTLEAMRAEVRGRFAQREARFLDATRLARDPGLALRPPVPPCRLRHR